MLYSVRYGEAREHVFVFKLHSTSYTLNKPYPRGYGSFRKEDYHYCLVKVQSQLLNLYEYAWLSSSPLSYSSAL